MTAPSPAGLSPLLDQLDEARAAATPGPWEVWTKGKRHIDSEQWDGIVQVLFPADAALIVAAVNALPELIRLAREREALRRAVAELAEDIEQNWDAVISDVEIVSALRALTAALTPGADTAGATA